MSVQLIEKNEQNFKTERNYVDAQEHTVKISLKDMTQEEKIQEAIKPLYLNRYE
ncbi:MAG: hypothetical protein NWE91_02945 [Candidatus Bathyarchaeota archaeon]|nr:hypothetical protein [Candidatus Bathyarchaeota archaeon]